MTVQPKITYTKEDFHELRPPLPVRLSRAEYCDWPLDLTPKWYQLWFADLVGVLRSEIAAGEYEEGKGDMVFKIMRRYPDLLEAEVVGALDDV